jgi:hypothetical protein
MVMQSAVLILPANLKTQGNTIGDAMGWGPESYTIPLSDNGADITHWGLRADVDEQFVRWITGVDPLPLPDANTVLESLIYDFSENSLWGRDHLEYVCALHNLTIIG